MAIQSHAIEHEKSSNSGEFNDTHSPKDSHQQAIQELYEAFSHNVITAPSHLTRNDFTMESNGSSNTHANSYYTKPGLEPEGYSFASENCGLQDS